MNTCSTCKHWTRSKKLHFADHDRYMEESTSNNDICFPAAIAFLRQNGFTFSGECNSPKFAYNELPESIDGLAYADGEGHNAYLHTGQDFGCIHWEAK